MQLVYGRYNLKKLLDNVEALMESRMSERQICFTKQINLIHEWFYCDELRINQVLLNLLSNAVKYTHKGGNVCLTVKEICDEKEKPASTFQCRMMELASRKKSKNSFSRILSRQMNLR